MSRTQSSITIRRPIADVFAVLTDVEQTGKWFPGDVEEHWTSPPPHGVGSTRHAIVRMYGRKTENDAITTEYDPPHRAAMKGTSQNAPFLATLSFVEARGSTRVDVTTDFLLRGPIRLLGPLIAASYGRAWSRGLARLKVMMESGAI